MNKIFQKETACFYLVALGTAIAAISAMCTTAFWRATEGVAAGLGLLLPGLVLTCLGYSHPSPLNKVRCATMFAATATLCVCFLVLFIVSDLARVPVTMRDNAGGHFNALGVMLLAYMGLGAGAAILTGVRVTLHATNHAVGDLERQLQVQSQATADADQEVAPRNIDPDVVMANADREVRASRMSIVPAAPEGAARTAVSPQEARERSLARRRAEEAAAAEQATKATPPVVEEEEAVVEEPLDDLDGLDDLSETDTADENNSARTIFAAEEEEQTAARTDDGVIYADSDDVDLLSQDVEMAQATLHADVDIRTEVPNHQPRQKETPVNTDWYTDFDYSGTDDDE